MSVQPSLMCTINGAYSQIRSHRTQSRQEGYLQDVHSRESIRKRRNDRQRAHDSGRLQSSRAFWRYRLCSFRRTDWATFLAVACTPCLGRLVQDFGFLAALITVCMNDTRLAATLRQVHRASPSLSRCSCLLLDNRTGMDTMCSPSSTFYQWTQQQLQLSPRIARRPSITSIGRATNAAPESTHER